MLMPMLSLCLFTVANVFAMLLLWTSLFNYPVDTQSFTNAA
jgi:hypothetical protein